MTTTLSVSPFAGHPVYDESTRNYVATPRPSARIKPEAQENANRNRGSLDFGWSPHTPRSSSYIGRYNSDAGRENLLKSRGSLAKVLQQSRATPRPDDSNSRSLAVKPEAAATAEQHKGSKMNRLISNYGKNEVTPRPNPRVKMEATANYQMSQGGAMNNVLHDVRNMPVTPRPGPRVKPEAEMIAMKNRGSMNSIMRTCTPRY